MTPAAITAVLMAVSFLAGVLFTRRWYGHVRRAGAETASELERDIVRAAIQHGGRITALDVRSRHAQGVEEVERHLRRLHAHGYCESDLASEGHPVFVFPAFDEAPMRALRVEKQILRLARDSGGLVRVGEVAVETDLAYLEARRLLDEMVEDGICSPTAETDAYSFAARTGRGGEPADLDALPRAEGPRREPA